jgi:hypothetical protein
MGAVSAVRGVVDELAAQLLPDADVVWRLSMAACELLDNARKYGQGDVARLRVAIEPLADGYLATVQVQSVATADAIGALQRVVLDMKSSADAWTHYLATAATVVTRSEGSGLGLARIWAEGEMQLDVTFDDEGRVTVGATLKVESPT